MTQDPLTQLAGVVEVDEGYIGGKRKGGRGRKAAAAVLVERDGRVKAKPMQRIDGDSMEKEIRDRPRPRHRRAKPIYRVDGDVIVTDQPSSPREERTRFALREDGSLILEFGGASARSAVRPKLRRQSNGIHPIEPA